jgi:hypothetical protein
MRIQIVILELVRIFAEVNVYVYVLHRFLEQ